MYNALQNSFLEVFALWVDSFTWHNSHGSKQVDSQVDLVPGNLVESTHPIFASTHLRFPLSYFAAGPNRSTHFWGIMFASTHPVLASTHSLFFFEPICRGSKLINPEVDSTLENTLCESTPSQLESTQPVRRNIFDSGTSYRSTTKYKIISMPTQSQWFTYYELTYDYRSHLSSLVISCTQADWLTSHEQNFRAKTT